jgi:glyoxylase-like metal-dependent hydrolase (beta-lactamase superfamily II)
MILGELMTNCYIVGDGKSVAVIDPADNAEKIVECVEKEGAKIEAILLTHGHFDHTGALVRLKEITNAKVYIHELDEDMLGDNEKNLAFMTGAKREKCKADVLLSGGEKITFGENTLLVMATPGHSPGSVSYIDKEAVFSGDLIFKGSIGRFDYGSFSDEMDSVKRLLDSLPDETVICPGHGDMTNVKYEKENNPYIR